MEEKTDWFEENRKTIYIAIAIIVIIFLVVLMLKFWMYSLTAIIAFVGGYFFAKRNPSDSSKK